MSASKEHPTNKPLATLAVRISSVMSLIRTPPPIRARRPALTAIAAATDAPITKIVAINVRRMADAIRSDRGGGWFGGGSAIGRSLAQVGREG